MSLLFIFLLFILPVFAAPAVKVETVDGRKTCTVTSVGDEQNDVPNILSAFKECGSSGTVIFPEGENYWIAERFTVDAEDVDIEWRGIWTFSDDIEYWRENSYPITFQNHAAGFILKGNGIHINGHGTGGINGNGDLWYTDEAGTTKPGRPIPFQLWNISNVIVQNFAVLEPQLWAINIMNGTNLEFENIHVNATATKAPSGKNWVQNTDGFDTMDTENVRLKNFTYTGGDDCIAIKPRSYNIHIDGVVCNGGNGVAIGSLGQYLEDSSVESVFMQNVPRTRFGIYIKTWIGELVEQDGYESGDQPRGGGWGNVHNVTFSGVDVTNASRAVFITQNEGNNGSFAGTSKMEISNIAFDRFTGTLASTSNKIGISCSKVYPCYDIAFSDTAVESSSGNNLTGKCTYVKADGVHGLSGC
ncbi:putative extracellular exo-polygalacturonase [Aspergillus steynii IBT 23096]|uniref:galacturonan 1,4-alpha-galacturonidase n=1 Tax=Aspergillus steynii IBT 23096 TaxID=1392250 RepID=A0A2I2GP03_9EURO|nr:putative extracellular exo-polygalacturonase [Aspergillus steynii IBT 23096]PLB54605.1 putative extracellular exo-polygalacturonase [Aspergillus steynii IBT 23096]